MNRNKVAITVNQNTLDRVDQLVSQHIFNQRSETVIAMTITSQTQHAGFPLTFEIKSTRLPKQSWEKISQIRTLSIERIGKKIGTISSEELEEIIEGLNEIIST